MKVIILAGGYGTRLGNITEAIPKPMVKIGKNPILWHIMKIYAYYGYTNFVISCGYKSEVIKEYFYNYESFSNDFTINLGSKKVDLHNRHNETDWKITLIDTGLDTLKGARIKRLEKFLDDENMVTYGDGVANIDINELVRFHRTHGKILTVTGVRPPSRFGEILEEEGKVISFEEKSQTSIGWINGGYMIFKKELLEYLTIEPECDLEYGTFEKLASKGEIMMYKHLGNWECVDTERDLKHLKKLWIDNRAFWKMD